ncbi:MAG: two-component sensor histidine kinase [Alteromonadaceae bacterium]|nr:MAG: two-component sensor histidine kinase [Alteromonadaceae bacterium]
MTNHTRRPLSLTLRVLFFVAIAFGVSLAVISQLLLSSIERHFSEQDADEIRVMVSSIKKVLHQSPTDKLESQEALSRAISGHHGVYYQVERNGVLFYSSSDIDFRPATSNFLLVKNISAKTLQTWRSNNSGYRGVVIQTTIDKNIYRITSAIDMDFHQSFLNKFTQSVALILFGSGVLTLFAAWLGVHQGLNPLRGLSAQIDFIQTDKLNASLDTHSVPLELKPLVQSFNHMLIRLEEGFIRLSHFSADIAHELRTPLTNIVTQTQVVLSKERKTEDYRELLYSNLEDMERLSKMVSDMLWLAKSENGLITPTFGPINLHQEVQSLFDFFEALAEDSNITLAITGKASKVSGDRELIRRTLTNLLSNAIRHTPAEKAVQVTLVDTENEMVSIAISNEGSTIPTKHLERIFDRFYRVDPSRQRHSDGTGLGLAIVKTVVEAHKGVIYASSSNHATIFTIHLPKHIQADEQRTGRHPVRTG